MKNLSGMAHSLGKEVHAWTVNYRGDIKRMIDVGADNIITDNPVLVRKVMNRESETETGFWELMKYALQNIRQLKRRKQMALNMAKKPEQ